VEWETTLSGYSHSDSLEPNRPVERLPPAMPSGSPHRPAYNWPSARRTDRHDCTLCGHSDFYRSDCRPEFPSIQTTQNQGELAAGPCGTVRGGFGPLSFGIVSADSVIRLLYQRLTGNRSRPCRSDQKQTRLAVIPRGAFLFMAGLIWPDRGFSHEGPAETIAYGLSF